MLTGPELKAGGLLPNFDTEAAGNFYTFLVARSYIPTA